MSRSSAASWIGSGEADGGLLAAGIAYNAVLASIPLGLLATGLAGLVLGGAGSRPDVVRVVAALVPPLAGVIDELVAGLPRHRRRSRSSVSSWQPGERRDTMPPWNRRSA
ncbi:MAG: hypothetical protein NVS9B8_07180 [Candidatus Limnocylindrales bacterium]